MSHYFGLYFGNTNLCIAVCKNEKCEVLANSAGDRQTPAFAALVGDEICVGLAAKQFVLRNTGNVLSSVKDLLLSLENADDSEKSSNKLGKLNSYDVLVLLFRNMVSIARNHSHENDVPVVVTVPLNFSEQTKQLVEKAVIEAGFRLLRTVTEPAAALLAYNLGEDSSEPMYHCLVYRLGGTTSDITVFQIQHGFYQILSSTSVKNFGGNNITNKLASFVCDEFCRKNRVNIGENVRSRLKLFAAAETCKHALSILQSSQCFAESLYDGIDLNVNVSRARFESLINSELQQCFEAIMQILEEKVHLDKNMINKLILTGGSCKIPKLQQFLSDKFPAATVLTNISPDEAMAIGASKEAALITRPIPISDKDCYVNTLSNDIYLKQIKETETINSVLLFKKGEIIPSSCQQTLFIEDTTPCSLEICEEIPKVSSFRVLGKFTLPLSNGPISIDAEVTLDQKLKITCTDIATNLSKLFII